MNIKLKAALEVTGMIVTSLIIITGTQTLLALAVDTYGAESVINAIAFGFMSVTAYVCVSLLYDIRVAKLQYKQKLTEMTKK